MEQSTTERSHVPVVQQAVNQVANAGKMAHTIPSDHEMVVFNTMARQAVESQMYRGIGKEAGVMMIMLAARELGIPPMQALNGGLNIIEGKVEVSARMMSAMIRRAGHSITIKESSDEKCILIGRRFDNGDTATVAYSVSDAQKAGLVKEKGGWKKVPKDMCFARAMSRLARQLFSDVVGIGYVEGEIPRHGDVEVLPSPMEEVMTEVVSEEVEVIDEGKIVADFINQFEDKEEKLAWLEYIGVVCEKLGWTKIKTIQEFMKDMGQTRKKFDAWNKKQSR